MFLNATYFLVHFSAENTFKQLYRVTTGNHLPPNQYVERYSVGMIAHGQFIDKEWIYKKD